MSRTPRAAWLVLGGCLSAGCGRISFDDVGGGVNPTDPYAAAVLEDAPVAYWRFGEPSGTVARDELGTYPGTYRGTCQLAAPGAVQGGDTAARFDGTSCRVDFGDVLAFAGRAPFASELWANPDMLDTSVRWLLSRSQTSGGPSTGYHLAFHDRELWFERFAVTSSSYLAAGSPPALNRFQLITVTFDGTIQRLYVDAIEVNSTTFADSVPPAAGGLFLGDNAAGNAKKFSGVLDEIAIYDHALPAARIAAHFTAR